MTDKLENQDWGDEMDRSEHEQTYDAFLTYTKHSIVVLTAILLFLLVFVYN